MRKDHFELHISNILIIIIIAATFKKIHLRFTKINTDLKLFFGNLLIFDLFFQKSAEPTQKVQR